jgi:uncharacterized YigZ family protein
MERIINRGTWEGERIKGSRFIVNVSPVYTIQEAMTFLHSVQLMYKGANHNCYALVLSEDTYRASDDGEPKGSAGGPILKRLQTLNIVESMIVVTRYFGGTKLGVGGLIRAYGTAAKLGLQNSEREVIYELDKATIIYSYKDIKTVQMLLSKFSIITLESKYEHEIQNVIQYRSEIEQKIMSSLLEHTAGRVKWITNKE